MSTTCKTRQSTGVKPVKPDMKALALELNSAMSRPWQWGSHDCSQFAIRCEKAMLGMSRFDDFIGGYDSRKGAFVRLRRSGFGDVWELVDSRLERLQSVRLAVRGDVIGHEGDGKSLGICAGQSRGFWCASDPIGIKMRPMSESSVAWRMIDG